LVLDLGDRKTKEKAFTHSQKRNNILYSTDATYIFVVQHAYVIQLYYICMPVLYVITSVQYIYTCIIIYTKGVGYNKSLQDPDYCPMVASGDNVISAAHTYVHSVSPIN